MRLSADREGLKSPGIQDVDRPAHVEAFAQPTRARRPRVQAEPGGFVPRSEHVDRIFGDCGRRRDVGQRSSIRSPEPQLAVGLSFDLISLLVDRAVVAPAEHREIRERGGSALGPVTDMMALAERQAAAREPAAAVAMVKRAPQRRGNGPRPGPDFHDTAVRFVPHHDPARVTRQSPGRFL
jgi:hypothetical protein